MVRPHAALPLALVLLLALTGCGSNSKPARFVPTPGSSTRAPIILSVGIPALATKNTTRVTGPDPVVDAAGVARAVYPGQAPGTRPAAAVIADARDWRTALAASVLAGPPVRAPILLARGATLPGVTREALSALKPTGSGPAGAQAIRVGAVPRLGRTPTTDLTAADPFTLAGAIDRFQTAAASKPTAAVVVVSADAPAFAMPAAGWAARSGDPILFVTRTGVPPATRRAIRSHQGARVYVLGPPSVIPAAVERALGTLGGPVTRISGPDPVTNAIAFARYQDASFGWGIRDPGHGLVFASTRRPLDAAAAAPLSASGTYGPLLLVDRASPLPPALAAYLLDIQPGYKSDPTRGVYNHGWLIGDGSAISVPTQAAIDHLLEIAPVKNTTTQP